MATQTINMAIEAGQLLIGKENEPLTSKRKSYHFMKMTWSNSLDARLLILDLLSHFGSF